MWEAWVWYLGWEEPLEEGMATHSSILAWRIPTDRGAWWAACSPWGHKESDMTEHLSIYGKKKIQGIEKGKKSKDTESEEAGMENGMKEILLKHHRDFPGGTVVKNLPCKKKKERICLAMQGTSVQSLVGEQDPPCLVVQSLSCVWPFATPWTAAHQVSLSFTISQSLLKFMSIESVMPQPSHPLLSPSPPAFNLSQHRGLFQWVQTLHQVAEHV